MIARRFHSTMVGRDRPGLRCDSRAKTGLEAVVLSGGVFLNALLTREVGTERCWNGRVSGSTGIAGSRPTTGAEPGSARDRGAARLSGRNRRDRRLHRSIDLTRLPMTKGACDVPRIPGKVVETYREHDVLMGKVDFGGVSKRVCLEHVPEVRPDEYVLVHVGFALSRIDEAEGAPSVRVPREGWTELDGAANRHRARSMKYLDEYRDGRRRRSWRGDRADRDRPWTIMEVCGGQTHTIVKYGIDEILPPEVELVHGPGCPVCVTPLEMIDRAHRDRLAART